MIRKQTMFALAVPIFLLLLAVAAVLPSHLPMAAVLMLGAGGGWLYLRSVGKCRQSISMLYIAYLLFLFFMFAIAQNSRMLRNIGYVMEIAILATMAITAAFGVGKLSRGVREYDLIFWLIGMLALDVVSTMVTYADPFVTVFSLYDTCRYLILMLFVMAIRPNEKEVRALIQVLSVIVLIETVLSVIQFAGDRNAFSHFIGKYSIVRRNGNYRAIGTFFHGIDLGNFSAVMFALFYNYNKHYAHSKYYILISIAAALCTVLSGTRTALANVLAIFLFSNLRDVKKWVQYIAVVLAAVLVLSNFIDIERYMARAQLDFSSDTPRNYYFEKGLEVWKDHPILGIGFGTYGAQRFRERTNDMIFREYDISKYSDVAMTTTDSFLAQLLPEYGVIGIGLIGMLVYLVQHIYRKKVRKKPVFRAAMTLILSVAILTINSSTCFFNPNIGTIFWITIGLILSRGGAEQSGLRRHYTENSI